MLPCQRHLFDIPDDIAYFNAATFTPGLLSVKKAGLAGVQRKVHPWEMDAKIWYEEPEQARSLFAQMIGARADDVAIVPTTSYAMSLVTKNLKLQAGQKIILLAEQFPSNVYPWMDLAERTGAILHTVARPGDFNWTPKILEAIDENAAVLTIPQCHWTDGSVIDLKRVCSKAKEVGAILALDLTQSLGACPFDVRDIEPDYVVASGWKWLMGPYPLAFLYVAPEHQNGKPLEFSWIPRKGSEDLANVARYTSEYDVGARRYDMGGRFQINMIPMSIAALTQILEWGVENISTTLSEKISDIAKRAQEIGLDPVPQDFRSPHMIGLRFPKGTPDGLAEKLAQEKIFVGVRGGSVRVAPHVYNNEKDIEMLFQVLKEFL